jgi:ATP-dependent Lon protease
MTRTWIDTHLNREQRNLFVDYLLERSANPTSQQIQDAIRELFPEFTPPSLNSCNEWRNKSLAFEIRLRQMRADSTAAEAIADAAKQGMGLSDANAALINQLAFEELQGAKNSEEGIDLDKISKVVARTRTGDQRARYLEAQLREIEAKLRKYEEEEADRKKKKAELEKTLTDAEQGGITTKTLEEVRRQLKLM